MPQSYPLAEKFVTKCINSLCPESAVNVRHLFESDVWLFEVRAPSHGHDIVRVKFSDERMDDFEEVLKQSNNRSAYAIRFKYYFEFQVHIDLGMGGITPHQKVSDLFLKEQSERRDWWKDARVTIELDSAMSHMLFRGLKRLDAFLSGVLHGLGEISKELKQTQADYQRLKNIVDYYESNDGSLNEDSASLKSLSMLKAAALAEIVEQEMQRVRVNLPEAARVLNRQIYAITRLLRGSSFLETPMPEWIDNYVSTARDE